MFLFDICYKVVVLKTNCVPDFPRKHLEKYRCCALIPDALNQNVSPVMDIWEPTVFGMWDKSCTIQDSMPACGSKALPKRKPDV